jgi:hypothetical protein
LNCFEWRSGIWWGFDAVWLNKWGRSFKTFSRNESAPSAYLNDANTDLTVRYLTDTDENSQVPLRFKAGKDGDYTLSIGSESVLWCSISGR